MDVIRYRRASGRLLSTTIVLLALAVAPVTARGGDTLRDAPVIWYADDMRTVEMPAPREPGLLTDGLKNTVRRPAERMLRPSRGVRKLGTLFGGDHVRKAMNVNSLGEVVNSSWFNNRIGLFPMTPEETAAGGGEGTGPSLDGPWTVVSAKTQGVTPGFNIRDARGDVYVIKFDVPGYLNMTTTAGVIANRILHAAGYNVPDDNAVTFTRDRLVLGEEVKLKVARDDGKVVKRAMTVDDLDAILESVDHPPGRWIAISSKFLSGKPLGPFAYKGCRDDDPNDRIDHENRRELRGLRIIAGWINHFDTKQHNSLDMFVEDGGNQFVRHYLIDFASTLGAGGRGSKPRNGYEYVFDFGEFFSKTMALGSYEADWRKLERPEGLAEVGYFDAKYFHPMRFKPQATNPAFANMTDQDGYWAAKIVSAFTDDQLLAICEEAGYQNPAAPAYVASVLSERRDMIARYFFDRVSPLDFWSYSGGAVHFHDLGDERGIYPGSTPRYRFRVATVIPDRDGARWTDWQVTDEPELDLRAAPLAREIAEVSETNHPFIAIEAEVDRGGGWGLSTTAYIARESGRVVAINREKRK